VTVHTSGAPVEAQHVVVATLLPTVDRGGFFAKARPKRSYGIAGRIAGRAPGGMWINVGSPTRSYRPWPDGGPGGVIVVGEGHDTGEDQGSDQRHGHLEACLAEHFEVQRIDHRWSAQDYSPADEVPYIGRSPRTSRTFVATGFNKWGLTGGTVAAMLVDDLVAGREGPWHATFDATRIGGLHTMKDLVADNLHVGRRMVQDRAVRLLARGLGAVRPGEGGLARVGHRTVGAYREPDDTLHAVHPTCTHMGCSLRWNPAETSWDCPCHGSRFDCDGAVLEGPAVRPLSQVAVDDPAGPGAP
jgi:glycine/D-amino acid oxidase-like deaminating enzyme